MKAVPANRSLELFTELLAVPSPPGGEHRMATRVSELITAAGYDFERDGAGNVTVDVPGRDAGKGRMVLASHMDELAMVVTGIDDKGDLRVTRSGGLFPSKLGEGPVDILGEKTTVQGVFSIGSMHRKDAADLVIGWDDAWIITGLSCDDLKNAGIYVGTAAVPSRDARGPVFFGDESDPLVGAWTFDDRMGVATLIRLLEEMKRSKVVPDGPLTVAFTVHEEGGCHGAKNVARYLGPEIFIAVDGCPMPPGTELVLDGKPGVWCKDSLTVFDPALIQELCAAAERSGTELQRAVFDAAASDASAVYAAGFADRVATVGHVRENSHGYEVSRLSVFENLFGTLLAFVSK